MTVTPEYKEPVALDPKGLDAVRAALDRLATTQSALDEARGALSGAARDVLAERRRQIEAEGWSTEHDDQHSNGEIAGAAAAYAVLRSHVGDINQPGSPMLEELWPWSGEWWKPTNPRHDLVKAGALILAEIERLDRLPVSPKQETE